MVFFGLMVFIYSVIWCNIRSFGFLFIRSSGFGLRTQLVYEGCAAPHILKLEWAGFEPMTSKILHSLKSYFLTFLSAFTCPQNGQFAVGKCGNHYWNCFDNVPTLNVSLFKKETEY